MKRVELGRIVRLQVQRSSLKIGPARRRIYDPSPIQPVNRLRVSVDGVAFPHGDDLILDVHNAQHPDSKNRDGINPVSIGFTAHYNHIRSACGPHVTNGIAGENILVETDGPVALADIAGGISIAGEDGRRIDLTSVSIAHPCVEFSRYVLNDPDADPRDVAPMLRFLGDGMRGFYLSAAPGATSEIQIGDLVFAHRADA
jgi:hypothetical protein